MSRFFWSAEVLTGLCTSSFLFCLFLLRGFGFSCLAGLDRLDTVGSLQRWWEELNLIGPGLSFNAFFIGDG